MNTKATAKNSWVKRNIKILTFSKPLLTLKVKVMNTNEEAPYPCILHLSKYERSFEVIFFELLSLNGNL